MLSLVGVLVVLSQGEPTKLLALQLVPGDAWMLAAARNAMAVCPDGKLLRNSAVPIACTPSGPNTASGRGACQAHLSPCTSTVVGNAAHTRAVSHGVERGSASSTSNTNSASANCVSPSQVSSHHRVSGSPMVTRWVACSAATSYPPTRSDAASTAATAAGATHQRQTKGGEDMRTAKRWLKVAPILAEGS
ncbi:hypothetical protein Tther_02484 [Tepidimonas thermarum]|uniref:Uncharacterized protein n=1 Tax=Tepidimonas thermarum TaxID=335431 RepID=A0A554WW54_9BURK|nr:hypothetical protein Tther_02484 [Tepidimonas thermarum]